MEAKSLDPIETHPARSGAGDPSLGRRRNLAWTAFAALAAVIIVSDQLLKQWIVANYSDGMIHPVLGDWLRVDFIHNDGGLFGLFHGTAPVFAVVTIVVIGLIALLEVRWGWHSWLMTLALGLLLGGAVGNFIDRIRLGYVVDFADIGIGTWRWYIFNIADMAVSCFFILLIAIWIFAPGLLSLRGGDGEAGTGPSPAVGPSAAGGSGAEQPRDAKGPAAE